MLRTNLATGISSSQSKLRTFQRPVASSRFISSSPTASRSS
nr:MAG TPA: hypothetical protein [Caudoviricetes sp.]